MNIASDFDEAELDELLELAGLPPHRVICTGGAAKDWHCRQRTVTNRSKG